MAGYCGQLYTLELMEWVKEDRVQLIFKAFQAIEVCNTLLLP